MADNLKMFGLPVPNEVILTTLLALVSPANHLPGFLSRRLCEADPPFDGVKSLCTCLNKTYFDSLETLCRSVDEASGCLEKAARTGNGQTLFGYSFDKDRFQTNMHYLCDFAKEFDDTSECGDNDPVLECENEFINDLNSTAEFSQKNVCSIIDNVSDCYWEKLKNFRLCPERAKILYAKLADAYTPIICTKYDDEHKGNECQRLYPRKLVPYKACVESFLEKAECLVRERKISQHHEDIYWETGFDVNRFIEFSKLTCLIEGERNKTCYRINKAKNKCSTDFGKIYNDHILVIKDGGTVSENKICRALEAYTSCVEVALKDCPIEVINLNSLICSTMPRSCRCPVNLAGERAARSKGGGAVHRPELLLILLMLFLLYHK